MEFEGWGRRGTTAVTERLRRRRGIADGRARVARQSTAHGRGRAPECAGHGPHTRTLLSHAGNRHALFRLKLLVSYFLHWHTLHEVRCCTSDLRPPCLNSPFVCKHPAKACRRSI